MLPTLAMLCVVQFLSSRPNDPAVIPLTQAQFAGSHADEVFAYENSHAVSLPHDMLDEPDFSLPVAWYRLDFELPVQPDRLWALYIPSVEMTPAIFVNGTLVGGRAELDDPLPRFWNRPILATLPRDLLNEGQNRIDIRVAARAPWGRLSDVHLGPFDALRVPYEKRFFWRVTFLTLSMVGSGVVALFMVVLGIARRDASYTWFGAFAGVWCLHNGFYVTVDVPVNNALWDLYAYLLLGLLLYTGSMFSFRFLQEEQGRWERALRTIGALGLLLLVPSLFIAPLWFNLIGSTIWTAMLLILGLYPAMLLLRHLLAQQDLANFLLAICFFLTICTGLYDWLIVSGLGYRHHGLLMFYASAPTLATMGVILLQRFVAALRESTELNRELEARVDQKALEIEQAFRANQRLQSQQMVSAERERIMRDMHDGVGSQLIGVLGLLDRKADRDRLLAAELDAAIADLRLMIDSLDDVDNDLVVALGLFRNRIQPQLDAAGLKLHWTIGDLPQIEQLGPQRVLHFMRILQEIVTNTLKHSGSTELRFETTSSLLVEGRNCVGVIVTDNGCGFDAQADVQGRGLKNIRSRALAAQLRLECVSGTQGTAYKIGFAIASGDSE